MPSNTSKEERKRKRAAEAQESATQTTKKVKRDRKSNGAQPGNDTTDTAGAASNTNGALAKSPSLPIQAEGLEQEDAKDASRKKEKRKSKKEKATEAKAETSAPEAQQDVAETAVVPSEEEAAGSELEKSQRREEKFRRKHRKYIDKFHKLEEAAHEGKEIGRDLHLLLKDAQELIVKHDLTEEDELVRLHAAHKDDSGSMWNISAAMGGRHIDHDPVFSTDERYIILATRSSIHVYEAETSLLVRTMKAYGITCYNISKAKPEHLYVGTSAGDVQLFDWTTSEHLDTVKTEPGAAIRALKVVRSGGEDEVLFTIEKQPRPKEEVSEKHEKKKGTKEKIADRLTARRVVSGKLESAAHTLLKSDGRLQHLRIVDNGKTIIMAGYEQMTIGALALNVEWSTVDLASLQGKYRWRKLASTHAITSFDAYLRISTSTGPGNQKQKDLSCAVALGNAKGEVLVYENIVAQLDKLEADQSTRPPQARVFRWHREAPNAVRWSKDGNYVISGGNETVLCLWQLETGRRQDLPHLTAAIRDLTISPSGTSYAVHLADNSLIVLSTSELQPKTHIAGPQSLCIPNAPYLNPGLWQPVRHLYRSIPVVSNPMQPKDILLAVPVEQQSLKGARNSPSAPFLQTYSIQAGRHISRQALTRNLATESNVDSDWNKLDVPNVSLMALSHDGQWLATVEDWLPPARDVQYLATSKAEIEAERLKRRETYLKIWHWNDESKSWVLNTRIAQPHADLRSETANQTFHLVSHPTRAGFATVGEDGKLRAWRPRTRGGQTAWFVKSVVKLPRNAILSKEALEFSLPATPVIARVAYSNDGSTLAVCQQDKSLATSTVVHLLDAETGQIRATETGLVTGHIIAMGFLDRFLILLSDELRIWDVVIGTMVFTRAAGDAGMALSQRLATTHLAVSVPSNSFAVAGLSNANGHAGASVQIFKPTEAKPTSTYNLRAGAVSALTPLSDGTGFVVLDSQAEIRTFTTHIVPVAGPPPKSAIKAVQNEETAIQIKTMQDEDGEAMTGVESGGERMLAIEDDRQGVKSEELARIFATSWGGLGLPNVKDMFDGVAGLFAVKAK